MFNYQENKKHPHRPMTTSHRPQLEARSGAKGAAYVPTGTQHARLLPGHTKLKLRSKRRESNSEVDQIKKIDEEDVSEAGGSEESEVEDSDGDQEALLQELNKIRRERMIAKKQQQLESVVKVEEDASTPTPQEKPNWRKSTVFGVNKVTKPSGTQNTAGPKSYKNDITNSEYHQDFLRRYVR